MSTPGQVEEEVAETEIPAAWFPRVAFLPLRADQRAQQAPPQRGEPETTKRTVICSKCGEAGHNKRGCKK